MVHIYYGDGKGKTTISAGLALRCLGSGRKVLFFQFLKDNKSSEVTAFKKFENLRYIDIFSEIKYTYLMSESEKETVKEIYKNELMAAEEILEKDKFDMVVLDEALNAVSEDFLEEERLKDFILKFKEKTEIVLTGIFPSDEIIKLADYVSEIKKIKHPFDKGVEAREGIEF